jgi:hypothetical protein
MLKLPAPANSVKCGLDVAACLTPVPEALVCKMSAPGQTDKLVVINVIHRKMSQALDLENMNRNMSTLPPEQGQLFFSACRTADHNRC